MKEAIDAALQVLKGGGIILYPTDTIWGLGCDATNEEAVAKLLAIKERDGSKSLVCLTDSDGMLQRFVKQVPEMAWQLIDISDKPVTIIYSNPIGLAKNTLAADGSIGFRVVKHDFCQQLIHKLNRPLVSTSANLSGKPSPTAFRDISEEIKKKVDFIVPANCLGKPSGLPSSIIKLELSGEIKIIRK